jgi:hypothetical protein
MPRWAAGSLLVLGLSALTLSAQAQPAVVDKLTYRDRSADGKVQSVDVEVKESPAGVAATVGGKKLLISPADVIRVDPSQLAGVTLAEQLAALNGEDPKDPAKSAAAWGKLVQKAGGAAPERTRRYLQFREAYWAVKVADQKTGDDFKAEAAKAQAKMAAVLALSRKSWEVWPVSRTVARLQMEVGDFAKAAGTLAALAATPDLAPALRIEATLAEAVARLRAGESADAVLDRAEKDKDLPASGPLRERLAVVRAATKLPAAKSADSPAKLQAAIDQAKDPSAKAVGYNLLGDAYTARGLHRDAMWAHLWADVVFNQDKDEQVVAVHRLVAVFERLNDKERADEFRDRLPRVR